MTTPVTAQDHYVAAADAFSAVSARIVPTTVLEVASFALTIVNDRLAGRVRPMQSYEAYTRAHLDLIARPNLTYSERQFVDAIAFMVAATLAPTSKDPE